MSLKGETFNLRVESSGLKTVKNKNDNFSCETNKND